MAQATFWRASGRLAPMSPAKMHKDEVEIDENLVQHLLASQFPDWADFAITRLPSAGTDNALYRLGPEMLVRLPRMKNAAGQAKKEFEWLPRLAPRLPIPIPTPLALGVPTEELPWNWTICKWLPGTPPNVGEIADEKRLAAALARFVQALHRVDQMDGPHPGAHNFGRGVPLAKRDAYVRTALTELTGIIDVEAAAIEWEIAMSMPVWPEEPVWIHGDLQAGNLLVRDGQLTAIIDFGGLGVGDPAVDLLPAWNLFGQQAREVYRNTLKVDEATWGRGRGWALSVALIALPYYYETNPTIVTSSLHVIEELLKTRAP